ncbi:hypothetical protein S83_062129 [Arachis hypogaea]
MPSEWQLEMILAVCPPQFANGHILVTLTCSISMIKTPGIWLYFLDHMIIEEVQRLRAEQRRKLLNPKQQEVIKALAVRSLKNCYNGKNLLTAEK